MQEDPYYVRVATSELSRLARALVVLDQQAELNHRYRKLISDSQQLLAHDEIRLTQARGIAKKFMVLLKAAGGEGFQERLDPAERADVTSGLEQANSLVYGDTTET